MLKNAFYKGLQSMDKTFFFETMIQTLQINLFFIFCHFETLKIYEY